MSASYDSNLGDLFRALGWRRLYYQRLERKSLLMYKTFNGMTPDYLRSIFEYHDNVNAYRLRNTEEKLVLPQPRTYYLKLEWYPKRDQKGLFKYGEKDQLCAITLGNRILILKVSLKTVAMATSHSLLRKCFIVLAPTLPALSQNKI